jgi:hypothetical protein
MTTYITYQCTICRKTKDSARDTTRAVLNVCSITPGCSGRLLIVAEKSQADAYNPASKLASGPNDRLENAVPIEQEQSTFLSTSDFGSLTIAIKYLTGAPLDSVKLKVTQRKLNDVQYQQYVFRPSASTDRIPHTASTKDISGKFLRFDATAIAENRVSVLVNGVPRTVGAGASGISLQPNLVMFNSNVAAGSTVTVIVYSEQVTTENTLEFERNAVAQNTDTRFGSWSNIKRIDFVDVDGKLPDGNTTGGWYLYSCTLLSNIPYNTKVRIDSVRNSAGAVIKSGSSLADVRFLMASAPYRHVDRYYNFIIGADSLNGDYLLTSTTTGFLQLSANTKIIREIYPPIEIRNSRIISLGAPAESDFIVPDDYANTNGTDTEIASLVSTKIIGPI